MPIREVEILDYDAITKADERAMSRTARLTEEQHTMYNFDPDQDLAGTNWDVAIADETLRETGVYPDGTTVVGRRAKWSSPVLAGGAHMDVGEEITSQLTSHVEDNAETLEEMGESPQVSTPPNALGGTKEGVVPVEDTVGVGVQTEETELFERYHTAVPEAAEDVLSWTESVYVGVMKEAVTKESDDYTGTYNIDMPEIPD
jgi:hypothetical protein